MTEGWSGEIVVRCASSGAAVRLYRVLGPESSREVPRARAVVDPPEASTLRIRVETRDTGALRAALQTFLGWVQLEAESARTGTPVPPDGPS